MKGRIIIKDNEKVIRDQQKVAELLNEYFSSATQTNEHNQIGHTPDFTHISRNLNQESKLSLSKTTPQEVHEVMMKLKPNKATGCDLITLQAVKESAAGLCYPFSTLFFRKYLKDSSTQE